MKFILIILALLAETINTLRLNGVPKEDMMAGAHWRKAWPEGIDDSTDDDNVVHWYEEAKPEPEPIRYHDKMRLWQQGTWPIDHTWNAPFNWATYHQEIDDGSDDNEVVNLLNIK